MSIVTKLFGRQPAVEEMLAVKAAAFAVIAYINDPTLTLWAAAVWGAAALWNVRLGRR